MGTYAGKDKTWPFLLLMVFIMLLILAANYNQTGISEAELVDTDAYMRLVRVEQLAETGDWYDSVIHRSNYPYGEELHWTRPLDVMLLAGAFILTPWLGFNKGLLVWGILISPLLGICCLWALLWATRSVMRGKTRQLLLLLFVTQPLLLQIFQFGRPDHHSLLMLLFILLLGCLFRMVDKNVDDKYVLLCGFLAAFSMWVSVEAIFAVIMIYIMLGILWLIRSEAYARKLLIFSLTLFTFSAVFLFIERPLAALFKVEYDKISIAHLFVFMLAVLATYLLTMIKNSAPVAKVLKASFILAASGFIIWLVFPDFYKGPMAGINKDIVPIWLSRVSEVQPLWSLESSYKIITIGSIALFLIYFFYLAAKRKLTDNFNLLFPITVEFAVFLPLGIYQIRMDYYLVLIIIMLLAVCLDNILTGISASRLGNFAQPVLRVAVMTLFFLGLPVLSLIPKTATNNPPDGNPIVKPDLKSLSIFLNDYQTTYSQAQTILTLMDFGPEILYRTGFNVVSTPYHRNDRGILYNYNVMAAESWEQAKTMLKERPVDLIILSPASSERIFYKQTVDKSTFYERLIDGEKPDFLKEVVLPPNLADNFKVYRVE